MTERLRTLEHRIIDPVAAKLAPYVSVNVVSSLSLLAALAAGIAFWQGRPVTGAVSILANGLLDLPRGTSRRAGTTGSAG